MPSTDPPAPRSGGPSHAPRVRMSPEERRRQLVGIGLRTFVEHPVQDVSLDEVAAEAGVSRGLLFHYFPTKTDFHRAVVAAAGRRVLRNVRPDDGVTGDAALTQLVERFIAQVLRRRESYLALVYGQAPISLAADGALSAGPAGTLREELARVAVEACGLPTSALPVAHAWVAYVEDRALQWTATDGPGPVPAPADAGSDGLAHLTTHCVRALRALAGG